MTDQTTPPNTTASGAADTHYKLGNEFLPFHPSASHIEPAYRDGWNACYKSALAASAPVAPAPQPAGWDADDTSKPHSRADLNRVLTEWNETTGALPPDSGWFCEVKGMMEDAFDLAAAAPKAAPGVEDTECRCEPSDYVKPADYDGDGSVSAMARKAPLQQGEYLPLPKPSISLVAVNETAEYVAHETVSCSRGKPSVFYSAAKLHAAIDEDRAHRAAQASPPEPKPIYQIRGVFQNTDYAWLDAGETAYAVHPVDKRRVLYSDAPPAPSAQDAEDAWQRPMTEAPPVGTICWLPFYEINNWFKWAGIPGSFQEQWLKEGKVFRTEADALTALRAARAQQEGGEPA